MEKVVIYGRGAYFKQHKAELPQDIEVVAYADSALGEATSATGELYDGRPVLLPSELAGTDFDRIYICTDYMLGNRIFQTLIDNNIPSDKVRFLNRVVFPGTWEYAATEDNSGIVSTISGIKIKEQYLTDFDIVMEVFVKGAYRAELPFSDYIVLDMGMNIGAASLYFAQKPEVHKVYGFEPFPDTYKQAVENFERNEQYIRDKIVAYNVALLDTDETMVVAIPCEQTGWRNIFSRGLDKPQVEIECKAAGKIVKDILDKNQDRNVILKCDVEGSESRIFDSLEGYSCLGSIDVIMMEIHGDSGPLTKILKKHGYKFFISGEPNLLQMLYAVK